MQIKSGTLLEITHQRKGRFMAIACEDFDSEKETFYPVAVAEQTPEGVVGLSHYWRPGHRIPCRASFCTFRIIKGESVYKPMPKCPKCGTEYGNRNRKYCEYDGEKLIRGST